MTANEMKFSFMLKFDSMFEFSAPAYDDRQISYVLTNAQMRVFLEKYYTPANKYQRGFEADERRRRDLEQLIKQSVWIYPSTSIGGLTVSENQIGTHPNGKFFDLPERFLYAIEEAAITSEIPGKEVPVKPVTHDQYLANINNPYKRPYSNLVWRMDFSRMTPAEGVATQASKKRTELICSIEGALPQIHRIGISGYNGTVTLRIGDDGEDKVITITDSVEEAIDTFISANSALYSASNITITRENKVMVFTGPAGQPIEFVNVSTAPTGNANATVMEGQEYTEGSKLLKYRLRYLATPPAIVVDEFNPANQKHCVLDETLHEAIIDEAVKIAKASVKPEEYQIADKEKSDN